jgi:hypothetical protein
MEELEERDLFAMFALAGLLIRNPDAFIEDSAMHSYVIADEMIKARNPQESGLPAIKRKPRK